MKPTLSAAQFSLFTALVEERAGLAYGLADKSIFEGKLWARAQEAGFDSALDYYYLLRYDDQGGRELDALVQALVVHETFFFRELDALRACATHVIKPLVEAGQSVRVWSAACSTGEEPLSLAMLLTNMGLMHGVELLASDISEAALSRARAGKFGSRSLRQTRPAWAEPYLRSTPEGLMVEPELLSRISWRKLNLMDATSVQSLGQLDLILCRNVLIYFREDTVRKVVNSLQQRLRPNGVLMVGVSESLMRFDTGLACEERAGVFVYRKVSA